MNTVTLQSTASPGTGYMQGVCDTAVVAVEKANIRNDLELTVCCLPAAISCTTFDHNLRAVEGIK